MAGSSGVDQATAVTVAQHGAPRPFCDLACRAGLLVANLREGIGHRIRPVDVGRSQSEKLVQSAARTVDPAFDRTDSTA